MRKPFVMKASALFLAAASVMGCSGRSAPFQQTQVQTAQIQQQSDTFAGQGVGLDTHPHIDARCVKPAGSARDRAAGLVTCTAGRLPSGTRLYASDLLTVRDGNHLTIPSHSQIVSKNADGIVVLLDANGQVVQTFSRSAVIQVQKNGFVEAVLPGEPVPTKYQRSSPFEVIK